MKGMGAGDGYTVSTNVYEALGFPDHEAMHIKARLAMQIADLIHSRGLSQTEASKLVGLSQPKLSGLLRGQFRGISETKMMDCLAALGNDVEIVVRSAREAIGRVHVSISPSATESRSAIAVPATARGGAAS